MKATNQLGSYPARESVEGKNHPFLADMGPHHRRLLEDAARQMHFEAGESIFGEGEPADGLYLIQTGKVQLEAHTEGRGLVPIQTLGAGNVMGWSWLFSPYFWRFGSRALEGTDVLLISGKPIRSECESDHDFGYEMMKRLTRVILERLQKTRTHMLESGETQGRLTGAGCPTWAGRI